MFSGMNLFIIMACCFFVNDKKMELSQMSCLQWCDCRCLCEWFIGRRKAHFQQTLESYRRCYLIISFSFNWWTSAVVSEVLKVEKRVSLYKWFFCCYLINRIISLPMFFFALCVFFSLMLISITFLIFCLDQATYYRSQYCLYSLS